MKDTKIETKILKKYQKEMSYRLKSFLQKLHHMMNQ